MDAILEDQTKSEVLGASSGICKSFSKITNSGYSEWMISNVLEYKTTILWNTGVEICEDPVGVTKGL